MPRSKGTRIPFALQQVFSSSSQQRKSENGKEEKEEGTTFRMKLFGSNWKRKPSQGNDGTVRNPSKLTSFFRGRIGKQRGSSAAAASRKAMKKKKRKNNEESETTSSYGALQDYLDALLDERGYSTEKYISLDTAYHCKPTELQQASYGLRVTQAARFSDEALLRRLIEAGLSPNPCNCYGESLVHMVCRRSNIDILRAMLEVGCSLQVTDDYGRTPLHDACWAAEPCFDVVEMILDSDVNLLRLMDSRGSTPLSYVRKEHYPIWIEFFEANSDRFWPKRNVELEGPEYPPALTKLPANSFPIPDPKVVLPIDMVEMVAAGRIEPEEAKLLVDGTIKTEDDSFSFNSDSDSDVDDDDDDSFYDSDDDESDIDDEEMAELFMRAGGAMAIAQKVFENDGALGTSSHHRLELSRLGF